MINMHKNKETTTLIRYFFIYSSLLLPALIPQPFNDVTRFLLYCTIPLFGLYVLAYSIHNKEYPIINTASISFFLYSIFSIIILFPHHEFFRFGLAAITALIIITISYIPRNLNEIKKEIMSISLYFTIFAIVIALISFLLLILHKYYPPIKNWTINNRPFVFSRNDVLIQGHRLFGYGRHPNYTGMISGAGVISALIVFIKSQKTRDIILSIVCIILNCAILVMASSRTSILMICSFVFILVILYLPYKNKNKQETNRLTLIIFAGVLVFSIVVILCLCSDSAKIIILNQILRSDNIKTATGRTILQKTSINKYLESNNILTGLSRTAIQQITQSDGATHNTYIDILVSTGLINFIFYSCGIVFSLIYCLRMLLNYKKYSSDDYLLLCIVIGLFVSSLIENMFEARILYSLGPVPSIEYWKNCLPAVLYFALKKAYASNM